MRSLVGDNPNIYIYTTHIYIIYIIHTIYSGYGKYSDPLKFFTLCYIGSHLLKSFKFIFFLINVHTAPHIDRKTQNCWHFCRFIKKEKLKYHMVLSIQTLAVTLIYLTRVLSISSDHPWDGSTPSFESSCVWLYWLDLIRKATHLSI